MIDGSLQEDGNFEEVRWYNLALEHGQKNVFFLQKDEYQDVHNKFSRQKEMYFSQNGVRSALLFGLKEE